jgi:SAM-dependent MidA family methyltransferase
MSLEKILTEKIKQSKNSAIGFDEFMNDALYHNKFGYYRSHTPKLGVNGDFITAPEISDLFGYCLAKQIAKIGGNILEFGAGSGVLAIQILTYLQRTDHLPEKYYILEVSAHFKSQQQYNIEKLLPEIKDKVVWLEVLPDNFTGTIVANEVLDAMPTKRGIIQNKRLYELGVGLEKDAFVWRHTQHLLDDTTYFLENGYTTEINMQNLAWIQSLSVINGSFVALLIDYGYSEQEFFHPQRINGTLRCYKNHKADDNPFVDIGNKDITSWVNFSAIKNSAQQNGLQIAGYNTQAMFLIALGIEKFLKDEQDEVRKIQLANEIKQLVMPNIMGESFKLIALTKNNTTALDAFNEQNLLYTL